MRVQQIGSSGGGDVIQDGNNVITILEPGNPSSRHEVAQVLPKGSTDDEVCEMTIGSQAGAGIGASLNPIHAFVHDAATALILVVGSKNTRKSLFLRKKYLPFLAAELFATIQEKEEHSHSVEMYSWQMSLSSFEIQDEVITDLLRPSNRGLGVSISAEDGVMISGIHKEQITNERDLSDALIGSCDNRASHTLPPGASLETSTAIWEIELRQSEHDEAGVPKTCYSRIVIVDVPCVDVLVAGGTNIRQLESPTLHKSLLIFQDVCKRLSTPSRAALAPFRSSKLTHYLSEMLGGNSIVVGLGVITGGEPAVSRKTLELIGSLNTAIHFPVGGRELTEVLQGLLTKYRSLILQLQDEIQNGAPIGEKAPDITMEKVNKLQADMAAAILERNTAIEDRSKIFEMMEMLKAKYNTILSEKKAQAQELIKSEEDKLSIARALVELKLEYSQLQEEAEKEKFAALSELVAARNAVVDLDAQILLARTESMTHQENSSELDKLLKEAQKELSGTNASLLEVRENLRKEEDKNVELGSELLTLVNQKAVIQQKCDELQSLVDKSNIKLSVYSSQEEENANLAESLKAELRSSEDALAASKRLQAEAELEAKRLNMELDRSKGDLERAISDHAREKDLLMKQFDDQNEDGMSIADLTRRASRVEELEGILDKTQEMIQLEKANSKAEQQRLTETMETQKQKFERKLRDVERDLTRARDDLTSSKNDQLKSEKELEKALNLYRSRIASSLVEATPRKDTPSVPETIDANDKNFKVVDSGAASEEVIKDLVKTYTDKEARNQKNLEIAKTNEDTLRSALRVLYDKYRGALDVMEDALPKLSGDLLKQAPVNEQLLIGDKALNDAKNKMQKTEDENEKLLKGRVKELEESTLIDQQRALAVLNTYKLNLSKTEVKLAAAKKEIASLNVQVKELINSSGMAPDDRNNQRDKQFDQQEKMLKLLQDQLSVAAANQRSPRAGFKLKDLDDKDPQALQKAREYISELEQTKSGALLTKLRDAEERCAMLQAKNMQLTEDAKSQHKFLKQVTAKYKKRISYLEQQLGLTTANDFLLASGQYDNPETELKLPTIEK